MHFSRTTLVPSQYLSLRGYQPSRELFRYSFSRVPVVISALSVIPLRLVRLLYYTFDRDHRPSTYKGIGSVEFRSFSESMTVRGFSTTFINLFCSPSAMQTRRVAIPGALDDPAVLMMTFRPCARPSL